MHWAQLSSSFFLTSGMLRGYSVSLISRLPQEQRQFISWVSHEWCQRELEN